MFKMNKQSVWPVTIILSVGLMILQSCAAPSPQVTTTVQKEKPMGNTNYIQIVNFNLEGITHDDFLGIAESVAPNFASLPGLISKVWLSDKANNTYGGVYSWESQEACTAYRSGELYAGALANNPNFANLSDNGFVVLEEPSKITHMK
jgi:heme-degrading monooxygenase HmoA